MGLLSVSFLRNLEESFIFSFLCISPLLMANCYLTLTDVRRTLTDASGTVSKSLPVGSEDLIAATTWH
jgi:hypothetical protein